MKKWIIVTGGFLAVCSASAAIALAVRTAAVWQTSTGRWKDGLQEVQSTWSVSDFGGIELSLGEIREWDITCEITEEKQWQAQMNEFVDSVKQQVSDLLDQLTASMNEQEGN